MSPDPPAPRRLQRAEAVLARRTDRIVLVLEQAWNDENVQATLRTAEAFGVQHVWSVQHPHMRRRAQRSVTRGSEQWLSPRTFETSAECLAALRDAGCAVWVSDLAREAEPLASTADVGPLPERVALVIGREVGGASAAFLEGADRRLYLPMHGFTESFNLSVAAALLLQRLFDAEPGLRGGTDSGWRATLRAEWYERLAGEDPEKRERFSRWLASPPEPLADPRPEDEHRAPRIKKSRLRAVEEALEEELDEHEDGGMTSS